jgi:malonyl-CoA O-methyltransferase
VVTSYDGYDNPMVHGARHVLVTQSHAFMGRAVFEFGCGTGANLLAALRMGAPALAMRPLARYAGAGTGKVPGPTTAGARHDTPLALARREHDCALFCLSLEHVAERPLHTVRPPAPRSRRPRGNHRNPSLRLMGGVAAHFQDKSQTVVMPTFAHSFADHLNAFEAAGLHVTACHEWRAMDFGTAATPKMLKRGKLHPLLVHFSLRKHG